MSGWSIAECRMINDLGNDAFMPKFGRLHLDFWVFTNPKKSFSGLSQSYFVIVQGSLVAIL